MSDNVIRFTHPEQAREEIREQAALWLARLEGGASAEDHAAIERWLAEDPAHGEAFLELAAYWDRMTVLSELSEIFPLEQYAAASHRGTGRAGEGKSPLGLMFAFLACGVLGVGALLAFLVLDSGAAGMPRQLVYETAVGEQETIDLPDGSEVMLNTDSVVEISYSGEERTVLLERGEALFTVTSEPRRPFRVYAGNRVVEAVGTSFTVLHTANDGLEVMVTEGTVNLWAVEDSPSASVPAPGGSDSPADGIRIPLAAGEWAAIPDIRGARVDKLEVPPADMEAKLAWRHGMLLFQGDPLGEVIEEVGRYTSVEIEVDPSIRDLEVVAYFRVGDLDALFFAMQQNFPVEVTRVDNGYALSPRR